MQTLNLRTLMTAAVLSILTSVNGCAAPEATNATVDSESQAPSAEAAPSAEVLAARPSAPAGCGDGYCSGGETCGTCPGDCGECVVCGNGTCQSGEDCQNCPWDCSSCPTANCGDGVCNYLLENPLLCPQDCG